MTAVGDGEEPTTVAAIDEELRSLSRTLAAVSALSKPAVRDQIDALLDRRSKLRRDARRAERRS